MAGSLAGVAVAGAIHRPPATAAASSASPIVGAGRSPHGNAGPASSPAETSAPIAAVWGVTAPDEDPARVADAARAGVRLVRFRVDWATIEPAPGAFEVAGWDALASAARAAGVGLVAVVDSAPAWARRDPPWPAAWWVCDEPAALASPPSAPPTDAADLARFAARFAERYRDVLVALEVWREPNVLPRWRRTGPDPEDYATLLWAVTAAVRPAAPGVRVVSAPLAPTTDVGVCYLSDVVYLDRLARTGALAAVDAVGVVAAGFGQPPDAPAGDREVLNAARVELLRRVVARFDVDRPLWVVADPGPTSDGAARDDLGWWRALRRRSDAGWPFAAAVFAGVASAPPAAGGAWADRLAAAAGGPPPATLPAARPPAEASMRPPRAGSARIVRPWPTGPARHWALGVALVLAAGAAALGARAAAGWLGRVAATRPRGRARVQGWLAQPDRLWPGALALVTLAVVDTVWPWPANAPLVPLMVAVAARWPRSALATIAGAAPFAFASYRFGVAPRLGPLAVNPVELAIAVALGGHAVRAWLARAVDVGLDGAPRRARRPIDALDAGVVAVVSWAALSPLWAEEPVLAVREWRTVVLGPALYYGLLRSWPDRRSAAGAAWVGLVAGAVVAAAWGLAGAAAHALGWSAAAVQAEGVLRASGPYNSPNNLALIAGRAAIGLASAGLWRATDRRGGGAPAPLRPAAERSAGWRWARLAAWLAGTVVSLGLIATFSRGTILVGLPVSLVWLVWLAGRGRLRRRVLAAAAAVVAAVALALLPFARTERVTESFALRPGTTLYYRVRLWQSAWRMGLDHPVLGVGLDNFMGLYRDRYVQRDVAQERFLSHPHNAPLDWWTRLGLPGLALFAAWLVAFARRAARGARTMDAGGGTLWAAGVGALVYGLAHGVLDNHFFLVDLALYTWTAQAMVLASLDAAPDVGPPGFEPGTNRL